MTDPTAEPPTDQDFLREQIIDAEHKIARYANALGSCGDCQEADSLTAMLHTTEQQRDLLNDLLDGQNGANALLLDGLLAGRIAALEHEVARLSSGWRRGQSISHDYWELENRRAFLADLLCRYHAWKAKRPYFPSLWSNREATGGEVHEHPWYVRVPNTNGPGDEHDAENRASDLDLIQQTITDLLRKQGFPERHFKITAESDGSVLIMGYAHSEAERDQVFQAVCGLPDVRELLAGIQVVSPSSCPICSP